MDAAQHDSVGHRQARALLARPTDKNSREYFGKEATDSPVCNPQFCVHWSKDKKNAPVNQAFLNEVDDRDPQELMARLTGNYRRGNERQARNHPRNRGH